MPPPLLSIIIPSAGRQNQLNTLLTDLSQQCAILSLQQSVEIIVIDDGSQPALLKPYSFDQPQYHWLRLDKNQGAPHARKIGFQQSSGAFIHFHDSDDGITDNWLKTLLNTLECTKTIDILISGRIVKTKNHEEFKQQRFAQRFQHQPQKIMTRLQYNNCFGPLGGLTFSRRAVERMRFNSLQSCQDWDMCLDALHPLTKIVCVNALIFIKNDSNTDRISNQLGKKVLGFLKLGRIHDITTPPKSYIRLFYIHCINHRFKPANHSLFHRFLNRNQHKIFIVFLYIELKKALQNFF